MVLWMRSIHAALADAGASDPRDSEPVPNWKRSLSREPLSDDAHMKSEMETSWRCRGLHARCSNLTPNLWWANLDRESHHLPSSVLILLPFTDSIPRRSNKTTLATHQSFLI